MHSARAHVPVFHTACFHQHPQPHVPHHPARAHGLLRQHPSRTHPQSVRGGHGYYRLPTTRYEHAGAAQYLHGSWSYSSHQRVPALHASSEYPVFVFSSFSSFYVPISNLLFDSVSLVPMAILFFLAQHYYRNANRDIKRIDSASKSPLFQHLGATLSGLPVLRAFRQEARFSAYNEIKVFFFLLSFE